MNYQNYTTEDFVLDKAFRSWVEKTDNESNLFWHRFLENHPEKLDDIKKAKAIIQQMSFQHYRLSAEEVSTVWRNIQKNKEVPDALYERNKLMPLHPNFVAEQPQKSALPAFFRQRKMLFRIAASIVGFILVASLMLWWMQQGGEQVYTTAYGETSTVQLPDGSVATLNANSTLKIPGSWQGRQAREVWLEGEAFFQVEKTSKEDNLTKKLPYKFIVHSREVAVEVLGTRFNVNTRREKVQVVLNSGKVSVKWNENELMMQPGDLVEVHHRKGQVIQKLVQPELYSSWKDGRLLCNATPIGELARTIEERFGYQVVLLDSGLSDIRVSGTIPMDHIETFNLVLSKLIQGQVKKQGEIVYISR